MKVRVVTSLREFDALAPIWREVTVAGGQTTPFLSHDWFACCWRTAGPQRQREVWLVEDAAGPVGLIPLLREKGHRHGLQARVVGFLDSPDTPFTDFLVAGAMDDVIETFLRFLRERRDWDVLHLPRLPAGSKTAQALQTALPAHFPWREAGRERSPYLAVSGSWEEFVRQKTQRFRETCRNLETRLRRSGAVDVEEHREVDPDGPLFAEALDVSYHSWEGLRALSMATTQGMPRFFRELTRRASANGWLHLWILRLDGRAVATEYQVGANGSLHALRADFDTALADLSPGACLNQQIIRSLFERPGVREYDMGPGANPNNIRWATGARELLTLEAYAASHYGRLLRAVETRLVPLARRWRERVRGRCA